MRPTITTEMTNKEDMTMVIRTIETIKKEDMNKIKSIIFKLRQVTIEHQALGIIT